MKHRVAGILFLFSLMAGACDIPQDPRSTLASVRNDTIRVGVTESPPWVIRTGEEPRGVEPELIRHFAQSIGAEVRWTWGTEAEHMEALILYELDVAVGRITRGTPWRKHVALTQPYHVTSIRFAGPPGSAPVGEEDIEDRTVAVEQAGALAGHVRKAGADPRRVEDLTGVAGIVAAPAWRLTQLGRDTTGHVLVRERHVMAVPPGENAFLMALENALHASDVATLLDQVAGGTR